LSFIEELKRRNVFKVTVAYGLVAWLIAQLAEFAVSTFGAPDWVLRTFVVLLMLGLPVAITLAWAFDMTPSGIKKASSVEAATNEPKGTNFLVVILLGVVLAAAVVLQFWSPKVSAPGSAPSSTTQSSVNRLSVEMPSLHADIAFPEDTPLAFIGAATLGNGRRAFSISPDGEHLVFIGEREGEYAMYLRNFESHTVRKLSGTQNAYDPFFSPNGQWIAFFAGNQLKRVARAGGDAVSVAEATNSVGGTWVGNDRIFAFTDEGSNMLQHSFVGERKESDAPTSGNSPHALPDGKHVLWDSGQIIAFNVESQQLKRLPISGSDPRYLGGFLFYAQGDTLVAARFDPESLTLKSTPVPVLTGLRTEIYGFSQWALANNGTLLYAPGFSASENPLIWVDDKGQRELDLPQRQKGTFEISPDGKQLLVAEQQSGVTDLWLYDLETRASRKLTSEPDIRGSLLSWMPDGKEIIYHRVTGDRRIPHILSLNSSNPGRPLLDHGITEASVYSISANGRYLAVRKNPVMTESGGEEILTDQVVIIDRVENREIEIPMVGTGNWGMAVSPEGDAIVYTSSISGEYQNYLQPVPVTGVRYQVSRVGGAEEPRWSRDGTKIYYRSGLRIMVVDVQREPEFILGEPRIFYEGSFVNVSGRSYDISPDGTRALVIRGPVDTARSIRLITNWLEQVERIVSISEGP
jgi:serine/threonine-protein kinase